jgi:DNA-directed RNA polymerase subunit K/omega
MAELKDVTDDLFESGSDIETDDDDISEVDANDEVDANEVEVDTNEVEVDTNEVYVDTNEVDNDEVDNDDIENDEDEIEEEELNLGKIGGAGKDSSIVGNINDDGDEDIDDGDDEDDDYLQKFNKNMRDNLIDNFHPESKSHNYEEIKQLAKVTRNKNGIIVDVLHRTLPILTKYEKTRVLGQRAKQIESGGATLVQVPANVIDSYLIAKLELAQNKIPFIIRRPLPSGGMEYWYVSDLENL